MLAVLRLRYAAWHRELSGKPVAGRNEHGLWLYTRELSLWKLGKRHLGKHARCVSDLTLNKKKKCFASQVWIAPRYCDPGADLRIAIWIAVRSLDVGRFPRSWPPRFRFLGDDTFCEAIISSSSFTSCTSSSHNSWLISMCRCGLRCRPPTLLDDCTRVTVWVEVSVSWISTQDRHRSEPQVSPHVSYKEMRTQDLADAVHGAVVLLVVQLGRPPLLFWRWGFRLTLFVSLVWRAAFAWTSPSHHFSTRARRSLLHSVLLLLLSEDLVLWSRFIQLRSAKYLLQLQSTDGSGLCSSESRFDLKTPASWYGVRPWIAHTCSPSDCRVRRKQHLDPQLTSQLGFTIFYLFLSMRNMPTFFQKKSICLLAPRQTRHLPQRAG